MTWPARVPMFAAQARLRRELDALALRLQEFWAIPRLFVARVAPTCTSPRVPPAMASWISDELAAEHGG